MLRWWLTKESGVSHNIISIYIGLYISIHLFQLFSQKKKKSSPISTLNIIFGLGRHGKGKKMRKWNLLFGWKEWIEDESGLPPNLGGKWERWKSFSGTHLSCFCVFFLSNRAYKLYNFYFSNCKFIFTQFIFIDLLNFKNILDEHICVTLGGFIFMDIVWQQTSL